jgi:hypothetical protein
MVRKQREKEKQRERERQRVGDRERETKRENRQIQKLIFVVNRENLLVY